MIANSTIDILKNETIRYNSPILVNSHKLNEVYHYTREFITEIDYKLITIRLNIPLTGIDLKKCYARILLYLDDKMLCDGSIWSHVDWELKPIFLEGSGVNIKKGIHKIKLMCSVTGGNLNIPYFDITSELYTIKPELSSQLTIIAQN